MRQAVARRSVVREGLLIRLRRAALGVGAVSLALTAYVNAVDNPFVHDDVLRILNNPSLNDPHLGSILRYDYFHPLVTLSYAFDAAVWGFTSFGFHVTSIVLHAVAVGLFYGWCTRAFADAFRTEERLSPDWPAFVAAALFGVHPITTEAVGYVSARSEVLGTIGFVGALILARRAIQSRRRMAGVGAVVAWIFALAAKETAVMLPVVLLAYDTWVLSPSEQARGVGRSGWKRRLYRVYVPAFAAAALVGAIRVRALAPLVQTTDRGALENLLTQTIVIWRYLALLFVPRGQTIMHDARVVTSIVDPIALAALAGLVALIGAAIWMRGRYPLFAVGVVWSAAALAPSSSIIPLRDVMAEHRMYLASAGLLFALTALAARTLATRAFARIVACAVVVACVALTTRRNVFWASEIDLWKEAAARSSNWPAHYAYAEALRDAGRCELAIAQYRIVLSQRPDHEGALRGLRGCGP